MEKRTLIAAYNGAVFKRKTTVPYTHAVVVRTTRGHPGQLTCPNWKVFDWCKSLDAAMARARDAESYFVEVQVVSVEVA